MHKLDNLPLLNKIDTQNFYSHTADLPEQFSQAWSEARLLPLPSNYIQFANVVILGMGGSGIGGALVKSLIAAHETVPVTILRDYTLPTYVGRNSLVVAVSYSGNTEETVSAFTQAAQRGAKLLAISGDGDIERLAGKFRAPLFRVAYTAPPRATLGYSFVPLLSIFSRLGLLEISPDDLLRVVRLMEERRNEYAKEVPFAKNPAKKLAEKLVDRSVVMIGSGLLTEVARRWKTQINENAKQAAFLEMIPEFCHNTIVGLDFPQSQVKQLVYVLLPSKFDHSRNQLRMKILPTILARKHLAYEIVAIEDAPTALTELSLSILLSDFVAYYLAILNGVDPTPTESIDHLKQELTKHPS